MKNESKLNFKKEYELDNTKSKRQYINMSRDGIEPSLKDFQSNALPLSYREYVGTIICFCNFFFNLAKEENFFFFFFFGTAIYIRD